MMVRKSIADTFWTGISALDQYITPEGLPMRSLNVIGGGPGTGKTVLALQILFNQASAENRAIYFTTISEPTVKFLSYLQSFDFYDPKKMFNHIVVRDIGEAIQTQPLPQVIETINQAIAEENARLVVIDSFKAISDIVPQADQLRVFAYNLAVNLVSSMCTAFLVGEYTLADMAEVPIFAIADGIMFMSFQPEGLNRQRYMEVHKVRSRYFVPGLHPFSITADGITAFPRIRTPDRDDGSSAYPEHEYHFPSERASTGVTGLDEMLHGGLPVGTATMVAGGAGTGKTLLGLHFITAGIAKDEPGVIVTFQENPAQLRRIASGFGWDLKAFEKEKMLVHLYHSPVELQPDIHTGRVKRAVESIGARRILIDSLKDLEIATRDKVRYKDYVYALVNEFKRFHISILLTNEIPELFGPFQLSEWGVSFIADNVILQRYVETRGQMGRALSVLKVRGSQHSKDIREFFIADDGIHLGQVMSAHSGVLTGMPVSTEPTGWRDLTALEQYLMETLRSIGPSNLDEMSRSTQIPHDNVQMTLNELAQRGYVLVYGQNGEQMFKASI